MAIIGTIPRRCVNLPPGSLLTLVGAVASGKVQEGPAREGFEKAFAEYLGVEHVFGASTGRSAFQLALEALELPPGSEIVFPMVTFPVMPAVAKLLGYVPVFCRVDPETYNAGPKEIEAVLTEKTGAVLATHLFGKPCPIEEIAALTRARGVRLLEDCAHALGVRVGGKSVGTFGDVGIFSFAQGKNMPCYGGGAIAVMDDAVAERAKAILAAAPMPEKGALTKQGLSIWVKWLLTRPLIFGLTAYQALRLKQWLGKPLMDSAVGDELIAKFEKSNPRTERFSALQGAIGLKQLKHIDAFNAGARENARVLTEAIGEVEGLRVPEADGDHIYVYYPLGVDAEHRDDLRAHLLKHGIDTKRTDMSDCGVLKAFRKEDPKPDDEPPAEAALLEICVYPVLSNRQMRKIARVIHQWDAKRRTGV